MLRISMPVFAFGLVLATGATTAACAQSAGRQPAVQGSADHEFRVVTVAEGLDHPWSLAFLPDGRMLVTERDGRLRVIRDGVVQPEAVAGVPAVWANGQGGLLDVVPHPDFASNRLVYLSFSKPREGEATTAVVRGRLEGNRLVDVEEIFEANAWTDRRQHFGSRLAFDRDGYLFITVGDRGASPGLENAASHPSQDLSNHQGTVNRLHDDGRVPQDNPFVDRAGARPEIWSYGHRNPQGLAIHPETGDIWSTEHAPQGGDELNRIQRGLNYGWPVIGHGVNYGGARIHTDTARAGMENPVHYWIPSIGTSGLMVYTGDLFPNWRGDVFAGGLVGTQVARLTLDGRRVTDEETLLQGMSRVRDIRQSPDGAIYIVFDSSGAGNPSIVRLEPVGATPDS
jgi:aldose sugar dehydrogenase